MTHRNHIPLDKMQQKTPHKWFCNISTQKARLESNHEEASDRSKLRADLQKESSVNLWKHLDHESPGKTEELF